MTLLKINRLLPIYISIVPLKFEVDIQSHSKVRVRKPKNPIWPPGGHFESHIAENQYDSAYSHHQHAYEIWNWNFKANFTYAPETMSSTDRPTDGRTDGWTDKVNPVYPPSNFVGRGYNKWISQCKNTILYIVFDIDVTLHNVMRLELSVAIYDDFAQFPPYAQHCTSINGSKSTGNE